jgi:hypothetical protein
MTRIKSNAQGVDVGYWESLLGTLKAHMARARLYDRHQDVVKQKLARMKCAQMVLFICLFRYLNIHFFAEN